MWYITQKMVTTILVPSTACFFNNIMYITPLAKVLQVRFDKKLGAINPYPWVLMIFNCFGWLIYSCLQPDIFLFWSVFPGMTLGIFYTLTAFGVLGVKNKFEEKLREGMELMIMTGVIFWGIIIMLITQILVAIPNGDHIALNMIRYVASSFQVMFLFSPLSTLTTVIRTRDSSSLHMPMAIVNGTNCVLWVLYGIVKGDPFLWVPNFLGLICTAPQIILIFLFPAHETVSPLSQSMHMKVTDANTPRSNRMQGMMKMMSTVFNKGRRDGDIGTEYRTVTGISREFI
mmetsp:Transcript_15295/g.15426  ORF Transcript_15295/g.15426 Transcript_15295/m.15426 type:complete len:287 (+) Transcript_15295:316-1176(+)